MLDEALVAGQPDALAAIAGIDEVGAAMLAAHVAPGRPHQLTPLARLAIARGLARATAGGELLATLLADEDPEVAHAALRTAVSFANSGLETSHLQAGPIAAALESALGALVAHLDARDAGQGGALSACAAHELDLATRACVARLMWATALEAAAAGRDPAPLVATARRLVGGREPDRKRALDVVQELQAGRTAMLSVIERWLRPPVARSAAAAPALDAAPGAKPKVRDGATPGQLLAPHDRWLARLCDGELAAHEATISALRRPALFATMAGPALAALAARAASREVTGELFAAAAEGNAMFVVTAGALVARRPPAKPVEQREDAKLYGGRRVAASNADRRIEVGGVVGELAVLTRAPRAATVLADGTATVLEIDRETFAAAARRTPELVLGLSTTLAGWLAPERPDVL
jgi:CRP-like cAMP-binding protein